MYKVKVYLAGGFKSNWQEIVTKSCGNSVLFFNPKWHGLESNSVHYKTWDLFHVKQCDILFAFMEEGNPSGLGLCLELGYARALNKTIILVDEKSKADESFANYFKIAVEASDVVFDNLKDGIEFLMTFYSSS